ncbi:MAG: hypothetical protein V7657_04930 [Falsihalocynthiibacter arcticus]|uniref:hypothetical protein n=1 Tax=unclassified Falsihalocynthiibacter TaxID=2854191 RepID=UPI00350F9752
MKSSISPAGNSHSSRTAMLNFVAHDLSLSGPFAPKTKKTISMAAISAEHLMGTRPTALRGFHSAGQKKSRPF